MDLIPKDFFHRDVFAVAKDLLGVVISCHTEGAIVKAMIVETEAYDFPDDLGSHAYRGKRTPRNESMYLDGGHIYMYVCYGTNDMLNFSTGHEGEGHAVLVRAVKPLSGLDRMQARRGVPYDDYRLCGGPGKVCQALGLNASHDGINVFSDNAPFQLFKDRYFDDSQIFATPRVGMSARVGHCSNYMYRYYIESKYVSRPLQLEYKW